MMKIIVRSPNWIGDAVLCLSSIAYIKEKMPQAQITVLAKDWVKDIFANHPAIDGIISINKSKIRLIKDVRRSNFDIGILFTNSFSSAFLFFLAGMKRRIGYKTDLRSVLLTDGIPLPKNLDKLHQRDYYLEIVKKLVPGNEIPKNPVLYISNEEIGKADIILKDLSVSENTKIVGMFPGASYGPAKMWHIEKFKSLAEKITKNDNAKILIFGGNKEKELGKVIKGEGKNIINLCGKTTVRELMALIKRCDVFITNDTGPMHMASALNIPVIAIFGPTNPGRTSPLGASVIIKKEVSCSPCKHRICPFKNHECMEKISVEEIFETTGKYIK
jgi:heptosyltransferase-2